MKEFYNFSIAQCIRDCALESIDAGSNPVPFVCALLFVCSLFLNCVYKMDILINKKTPYT